MPQYQSPAKKIERADREPGGDHQRREAAHEQLVLEPRVGRADELEQRLRRVEPERRVQGDPGRREQPDVRAAQQLGVAPPPVRGSVVRPGRDIGCGDGVAVDRERDEVDDPVREEGGRPEERPRRAGEREAARETGDRRGLEARRRLAAETLVAGGRHRDEPERRGHARGGRGALEQAREAEQRQAADEHRDRDDDRARQVDLRGDRGEDDRDEPEQRADLHDAVVAEPVGHEPEGRREDELRGEEERGEDAHDERPDLGPAVGRQVGEEEDEERAGQPGRQAEDERGDRDRPDGPLHTRRVPGRRTWLSSPAE